MSNMSISYIKLEKIVNCSDSSTMVWEQSKKSLLNEKQILINVTKWNKINS